MLKRVRCLPTSPHTAISVDQLWRKSNIDTVFGDTKAIVTQDGVQLPFTFDKTEGVYVWYVHINGTKFDEEIPQQDNHLSVTPSDGPTGLSLVATSIKQDDEDQAFNSSIDTQSRNIQSHRSHVTKHSSSYVLSSFPHATKPTHQSSPRSQRRSTFAQSSYGKPTRG